jgi:hypothetical protein
MAESTLIFTLDLRGPLLALTNSPSATQALGQN